jgi:hypothetical protein
MFSTQISDHHLFLLLLAVLQMLRLPLKTVQISKALLKLSLSPLELLHQLSLVPMMPRYKHSHSEDVRHLLTACPPLCSKMVLPRKAIPCPSDPSTKFFAPCAAPIRLRFYSSLQLPLLVLKLLSLMTLPLALLPEPKHPHPWLGNPQMAQAIITIWAAGLSDHNQAMSQPALHLPHHLST